MSFKHVPSTVNANGNVTHPLTVRGSDSPNAALVYLASLYSNESRRIMRSKLNCCARMIGQPSLTEVNWKQLRFTDVFRIMVRLESTCKGSTVNNYLVALKGIDHKAWSLNLVDKRLSENSGREAALLLPRNIKTLAFVR